jgi:hypothetical protein
LFVLWLRLLQPAPGRSRKREQATFHSPCALACALCLACLLPLYRAEKTWTVPLADQDVPGPVTGSFVGALELLVGLKEDHLSFFEGAILQQSEGRLQRCA